MLDSSKMIKLNKKNPPYCWNSSKI